MINQHDGMDWHMPGIRVGAVVPMGRAVGFASTGQTGAVSLLRCPPCRYHAEDTEYEEDQIGPILFVPTH